MARSRYFEVGIKTQSLLLLAILAFLTPTQTYAGTFQPFRPQMLKLKKKGLTPAQRFAAMPQSYRDAYMTRLRLRIAEAGPHRMIRTGMVPHGDVFIQRGLSQFGEFERLAAGGRMPEAHFSRAKEFDDIKAWYKTLNKNYGEPFVVRGKYNKAKMLPGVVSKGEGILPEGWGMESISHAAFSFRPRYVHASADMLQGVSPRPFTRGGKFYSELQNLRASELSQQVGPDYANFLKNFSMGAYAGDYPGADPMQEYFARKYRKLDRSFE
jgi:hypothetical protein